MRHRLKKDKLNRTSSHRCAMLSNMSISLITHERIKSTLPKLKLLRPYLEKLITKAKVASLSTTRYLLSKIHDKPAVYKLIYDLAQRSKGRQGGYLRIVKSYPRFGDNAPMAYISFVDQTKISASKKVSRLANSSKVSVQSTINTEILDDTPVKSSSTKKKLSSTDGNNVDKSHTT